MKKIIILFGIFFSTLSYAQEAQQFFQDKKKLDGLKNSLGPSKCVTIDVSSALDTNNQPYTYVWDLGDGTKQLGAKIRHCYPENAFYTASLTLADSATEVYFENEIVLNVDLQRDTLFAQSQDSISVDHELKLTPKFTSGKHYNVESYFWDFGNGEYSTNTIGKMTYSETGVYKVRLGAIVKKKKKKYILLCKKTIIVYHILTPKSLIDAFNTTRLEEDKVSPYLREDIYFTIVDTTHQTQQVVKSIEKFGYRIELKKGSVYQIYAKRGNVFSDIITCSTLEAANKFDIQFQFKQAIGQLTQSLNRIPSVYFQKTKTSTAKNKHSKKDAKRERSLTKESKQELKKVATLLSQYPMMKIRIGVYSHSGTKSINLFKLSMFRDRGNLLKASLVKKGVASSRIEIVPHTDEENPTDDQKALDNSCATCSKELDRRAEFKVVQIQ